MRTPAGLLFCTLLLASLIPASPALASEKKVMGDVVVKEGETVDEISTAWGDVRVEGQVEGDVRSGFGDIEINGPVGGDVDAGFGNVNINGPVEGDVKAGFGDLSLEKSAQVDGEVYVGHGTIQEHSEAQHQGNRTVGMFSGFEGEEPPFEVSFLGVIGWSLMTLMLIGAAVLLAVAAPRPLKAATRSLETSPGRSLVLGLGSLPATVVVLILLAFTGVGLLLIPLLLPAYLVLLLFGVLVTAYFLGRRVVLAAGRYRSGDALAATVGAILVAVIFLIPFVGGLVLAILALLGAGAAVSALLARQRPRRGAPLATHASYEDYLRDRGG
jgi:cytoskeletal protein CcmA (bactofilin family)